MMNKLSYLVLLTSVFLTSPGMAVTVPDGQIIVRVDDGATSRCINLATDRITMHLRRLVTEKETSIFTEDKAAALIINTTLSGEEGGTTPKKVSFPRMYLVTVDPYSSGYVSLPIEEKLFSRFSLTDSGNSYDTAEIEFTVIAKKDKSPLGIALSALADITRSLPAPLNPFSEGFKYFADYATKVVEGSLSGGNNVAQSFKEAKIALSFSSTGTCTGDQETTGTLAAVRGANGDETRGFVDINKEYCWRAEVKPVFNLKFATPEQGTPCKDLSADRFKRMSNPYVAFYLNAEPKKPTLSQNLQSKILTLSGTSNQPTMVSLEEIEKSVASAYELWPKTTPSQESHLLTVKKVSSKVRSVLEKPANVFRDATSTSTPHEAKKTFTLSTTAADLLAIDLAGSLKRCTAHGVAPEQCF